MHSVHLRGSIAAVMAFQSGADVKMTGDLWSAVTSRSKSDSRSAAHPQSEGRRRKRLEENRLGMSASRLESVSVSLPEDAAAIVAACALSIEVLTGGTTCGIHAEYPAVHRRNSLR